MTESDPYTQAINAMMTALRTLTDYFPEEYQVSFDPYDLGRGADYWFFVSAFASSPATRLSGTQKIYQWQTPCQLDVRYTTEAESAGLLLTARGAIIAFLHRPRVLRDVNVNRVIVTPDSKPLQNVPGDNPNFLIQAMTVTIEQIVNN